MPNTLRKFQYILEGIDQEQLTDILVKRLKSRYPDISTKYEEDVLHDAAMDVASFHAGAEELGTSDIGAMIREVIKNLERFNERGQGEKMIPNSVRGWRMNEETEPERVVRQLKAAKKYLGQDPEPKEPEEKETNESFWKPPSPAQLRFNRALERERKKSQPDREKFQKELDRIMPPPKKPDDTEKQVTEKTSPEIFNRPKNAPIFSTKPEKIGNYIFDARSKGQQGVAEGMEQSIPPILYHATYKPRLKNIKLKGLGAGGKRNWEDSKRGVVYLALDPYVAESYAETSDMVPDEWLDQIVILKISTAGLDPNKFQIDSNVQDNEGDTIEYHGVIPLKNISLYKQGVAEGKLNFEEGDCPIFAIALHRLSKMPLMALVEYDEQMDSTVLIHAYVKLDDRWRLDASGETDVDWMLQKYPNNGNAEEIEISEKDLLELGYGKSKCPTLQQVLPHAKEVLQNIEEGQQGVAEGLDEAVGGNYLYHATDAAGIKGILSSGTIRSATGPQVATQAQTQLPTVSVTRDWGYASGSNASKQMAEIGRDAILVLDRNAIESNFKTLGTSQSTHIRGMAFNPYLKKDGAARSQNTDSMARVNAKGKAKYAEPTAKAGGEFEEAVVVPKGALPLKGTMVGFWVNPKSELINDPAIMNDPRRLDMIRPNTFVKASDNTAPSARASVSADQRKLNRKAGQELAKQKAIAYKQGVAEDEHASQPRPRAIDSLKTMVDVGGIQLNVAIDGSEVSIRPIVDGYQAGYVVFDRDGNTLVPADLAIDEQFRGQGIAKTMYDYVKNLGFTIRRSSDQTKDGKHFWDKNRGEGSQVWEQTMTLEELDEACWKGYHKEGMKTMFGKKYPNCVKNEDMAEGWKDKVAGAVLAGTMAASPAHAGLGSELAGAAAKGLGQGVVAGAIGPKLFAKQNKEDLAFAEQIPNEVDKARYLRAVKSIMHSRNMSVGDSAFMGANIVDEMQFKKLKKALAEKYNIPLPPTKKDKSVKEAKSEKEDLFVPVNPPKKHGVAEEKCPHCNGPMFSEELINEKKDACYYKVKSRYKVWPSAYASGALVKCRKKGASNWGNSTKNESSILEGIEQTDENLHKWFKEKWVRFGPDGKIRGDCARGDDSEGKPKCLPQSKAHNLGKKGRASAAARKRREDPNPERSGKAINVATKKKTTESSILQGISETKGLPMPGSYEQENKPFLRKGGQKLMALTTEQEELDEKWSDKYKRSIDCNNPKGFSQRAHCQGRKKK